MQNIITNDILRNKETLNYLTELIVELILSSAIIGRNDDMFVVDASKVPQSFLNENDIVSLFNKNKLIYNKEKSYGSMNIFLVTFYVMDIYFFRLDEAVIQAIYDEKEAFPYILDVRKLFLTIPLFSEHEKFKYEQLFENTRANIF